MGKRDAGQIACSRYRLDRPLGQGGMGEVWEATHEVTGGKVALKFLKAEIATQSTVRKRFLREARAATSVRHPNVVGIHDVLEEEDGPIIVMDFLEGEPLSDRLQREGALSLAETARVLGPVVSAVGAAHAIGVVHRDLKPDNLFLARLADGRTEIKVLDFGLAKLSPTEGMEGKSLALTETGAMLGTPFYMSPEQAWGEKDVDRQTDVWSLGIILYECLTGRKPTQADNLGQVIKIVTSDSIAPIEKTLPELPAEVASLINRMLQRDRAKRPKDLVEVREVLAKYTDAPVPAFSAPAPVVNEAALAETIPSWGKDGTPPPVRRRTRAWLAALAVIGIGSIAGAVALKADRAPVPLAARAAATFQAPALPPPAVSSSAPPVASSAAPAPKPVLRAAPPAPPKSAEPPPPPPASTTAKSKLVETAPF